MSPELEEPFAKFALKRGYSLTPAQRELAGLILIPMRGNPELRGFLKARSNGVTTVFKLLEEFVKGL